MFIYDTFLCESVKSAYFLLYVRARVPNNVLARYVDSEG